MFESLPTDICIYAVTAIGPTLGPLATYCTHGDAVINGTRLHTCLGDFFRVLDALHSCWKRGPRTRSILKRVWRRCKLCCVARNTTEAKPAVWSFSIAHLTVNDFFRHVFESLRLQQHRVASMYTASAQPTYHGLEHWWAATNATRRFPNLVTHQQETQQLHLKIVMFGQALSLEPQLAAWTPAET